MLSLYWFSLQKYFCIDNANLIKNFKSTKISTQKRCRLPQLASRLPARRRNSPYSTARSLPEAPEIATSANKATTCRHTLFHIQSVDRQCHCGSLTLRHSVEMDITLVAAYPHSRNEVGREAHKPSVGVVVGRTGLAAHHGCDVVRGSAQAAART